MPKPKLSSTSPPPPPPPPPEADTTSLTTKSTTSSSFESYEPVRDDDMETSFANDFSQRIREARIEIQKRRSKRRAERLKAELMESRDAVLQSAKEQYDEEEEVTIYSRLPSNECEGISSLELLFPSGVGKKEKKSVARAKDDDGEDDKEDEDEEEEIKTSAFSKKKGKITIKFRPSKHAPAHIQTTRAIFLEGTHPPLPRSTTTIFLKTHFAIEDEQNLTYVPYFGDDDKEDVVSELYNVKAREKMIEFGSEYRERDVNEEMDEILKYVVGRKRVNEEEGKEICRVLAGVMDVDGERVWERWRVCFPEKECMEERTSLHRERGDPQSKEGGDEDGSAEALSYEEMMDSYRNLFCRRCFTYDCNMHGNLAKTSLELQGQLAAERENDGYWNEIGELPSLSPDEIASIVSNHTISNQQNDTNPTSDKTASSQTKLKSTSNRKRNHPSPQTSSPLQKCLIERAHLAFQGNTAKISQVLHASPALISSTISTLNLPSHPTPNPPTKKKKTPKSNITSMRNYNLTWLKRVEDAEIHPLFLPCDHTEMCSEETCSCIQNAFFCTKHCAWGDQSRNFFRGCACKAGKCRTKSCACFAAKRECDPDLCRTCGAGDDPPNQPAVRQRCRNDCIGMRRHCHLLMGESTVENAGWGIFTKGALKKGDFVHEYIGEVISQEEAERRGRIYDKVNRSYLFNLSSDYVVDASRKGNKTKFANHSSKPNCYTKTVNVNGDLRIGLFAQEDIEPQTELFFDYRYDVGIDNELIHKPGKTVEWMKNPKMANKISKKYS